MPSQFYRIVSINTEYYEFKSNDDKELFPSKKKDKELSPSNKDDERSSNYDTALHRSMDTDKLACICKKEIHGYDKKSDLEDQENYMGKSKALINIEFDDGKIEVREQLYEKGFVYDGEKYVRYKRSASSAREGKCLFIMGKLKDEMNKWSYCGLDPSEVESVDLASWEAYVALTLSGIEDTFEIPDKSILIIKDQKSIFKSSGVRVSLKDNKFISDVSNDIDVENVVWDGECLIDKSVFETLSNDFKDKSMLLLRNKFFKSCGFKTNLQLWFKDNNIRSVSELNGYTKAKEVEDIKIVITESSLKYLKFYKGDKKDPKYLEKALKAWIKGLDTGRKLKFGIVKGDKQTKYYSGSKVCTNYQFVNTLGLNKVKCKELLGETVKTFVEAREHGNKFKEYLENEQFITGKDDLMNYYFYKKNLLYKLLNDFPGLIDSSVGKDQVYRIAEDKKNEIARGEFLVKGTYAVLFGNPIELLYSTITKKYQLPNQPMEIQVNGETYQPLRENEVYTKMFDAGETICAARSPHITMGNLYLCKNTENDFIKKYFDLSKEIICVNSISQNVLDRLNGADFDSDTMLITNNSTIIKAVEDQGDEFLVPFKGDIDTTKNSNRGLAEIDDTTANNSIGNIVNVSQILNSILWTKKDEEDIKELYNYICVLEVFSNLEIDNSKTGILNDSKKLMKTLDDEIKKYLSAELKVNMQEHSKLEYLKNIFKDKSSEKCKEGIYHNTTLSHIYELVKKEKLIPRKSKNVESFYTSFLDGDELKEKAKQVPKKDINRIKLLAGYYYLCYLNYDHKQEKDKSKPDMCKCANGVKECYGEISKIIGKSKADPKAIIYGILKDIDEDAKFNEIYTLSGLLKEAGISNEKSPWSGYAKFENFKKLYKKIDEEKKNTKDKNNYSHFLVAALYDVKDGNGESVMGNMIRENGGK